jgi:hypothetical protein
MPNSSNLRFFVFQLGTPDTNILTVLLARIPFVVASALPLFSRLKGCSSPPSSSTEIEHSLSSVLQNWHIQGIMQPARPYYQTSMNDEPKEMAIMPDSNCINIATISAGFEKGDFLVREEQGNRVYFDFFEEVRLEFLLAILRRKVSHKLTYPVPLRCLGLQLHLQQGVLPYGTRR